MSLYAELLNRSTCQSIDEIVDWCHEMVPQQYKARPWNHPELNHGIDLLASDDALNCYMSAYGDMHITKCRAAMMNFPFEQLNGSIEIVDWGCGQGIGSATIVDVLKQRELLTWLKRITLIEPSAKALERAECNLLKITHNDVTINPNNKFMPSNDGNSSEVVLQSLGYFYENVIHVFSNILDIKEIDLCSVARMVASSHGNHYVLCIGPKNAASYRIEQFCSVFGEQNYFSRIDSARYALTKRSGHPYSCVTRCFSYDGSSLDYSKLSYIKESGLEVFDDYDYRLHVQNGLMSLQKARVAYRLGSILADDDIMYIDPVINEVKLDFLVVRPNRGIILLNVFEEDLNNCRLSEDSSEIIVTKEDGRDITFMSPIELISLCQRSIKDGIEELLMSTIEDPRNFSLIKKLIVFTENNNNEIRSFIESQHVAQNYTYLFGNEFINDGNVSNSLYRQLNLNISRYFDDVVKRRVAQIISPSWHSYREGLPGTEPIGAQINLSISRKTHQKISGVAGSGKTHVLAARAINAQKRTGGDVLILTYNMTLAKYLRLRLSQMREDFSWDKIDIYHYHRFFRIRASECHLHVNFESYSDLDFFANTTVHKRYSAIFIDEVQDYTTEWLRIVMQEFLEPDGEFVVFGDPKQNVYNRPTGENGEIRLGVIGGTWNNDLRNGRRFTNPRLASLAISFQSHFFAELPADEINVTSNVDNSLGFSTINYYDFGSVYHIDNVVSKLIDIVHEDRNEPKDFVIMASTINLLRQIDYSYRQNSGENSEVTFVTKENYDYLLRQHHLDDVRSADWKFWKDYRAMDRSRKLMFTTDKRCIKMSTIKSFKGWESPSVILILEDDGYINLNLMPNESNSPDDNYYPEESAPSEGLLSSKTLYSAITRARENLYVINLGNDIYDSFFREHAVNVFAQRRFRFS